MTLFSWKDQYSVKVKEIDNQHKMLIGILNELYEAMLAGEAKEVIGGTIKSLADYTGVHFSYEETLMKKHNFPGYQEHKNIHTQFIAKVADFQDKHKQGKLMLSMEVMNFLKDWLKNHINGIDKKYADFFNQKGVF